MKLRVRVISFSMLALVAATARAQEQDVEGCKHSALVSRFPGGAIHSCENKEYEQADSRFRTARQNIWKGNITTGTSERERA